MFTRNHMLVAAAIAGVLALAGPVAGASAAPGFHGYGNYGHGYGNYGHGYGNYGHGYGNYGHGYGNYGNGYGNYGHGYGNYGNGYGHGWNPPSNGYGDHAPYGSGSLGGNVYGPGPAGLPGIGVGVQAGLGAGGLS